MSNFSPNDSRDAATESQYDHGSPGYLLPPLRRERTAERDKRTYRACLHCRQRKSRCDLYGSGEPGKPPCERCIREQHECILGGSRRGGKRIKRTASDLDSGVDHSSVQSADNTPARSMPFHFQDSSYPSPRTSEARLPPWPGYGQDTKSQQLTPREPPARAENNNSNSNSNNSNSSNAKMTVDETIASAELTNPSDALEFLANVADRAEGSQLPPMNAPGFNTSPHQRRSDLSGQMPTPSSGGQTTSSTGNVIQFPPLQKGYVNIDMMHELLHRYGERYHPFFPLANPAALDPRQLPTIAAKEPHLLAAICTIASKDEQSWWQIHESCSSHMQELIATLVYGGGGEVEAVEALLILAEWVPRRPQSTPAVGRGEEDNSAWMFVGTAVRLGYLLGLDRTGFRDATEPQSAEFNRKRLAWSACYMSDRQISIRIGRAFWSRGPGPMTGLNARDFPSLRSLTNTLDDYAAIYEANLELTQLFSNAHDVLYSSRNRSAQLNFGGEYVKYIDDFRVAIRAWHNTWGMLSCSPPMKASLILSYEYLRLYVNAFAYQATLTRMVSRHSQETASSGQSHRPATQVPFTDFVAATPDARFIYDSIDAAKSLLSTFNSFVDPILTFRYMPLRYYLYVIYSACFLYKARSTGVLGGDRSSVKRMIADAVERLQKASACPNDVGDRYSRLIRLLWRKPPVHNPSIVEAPNRQNISHLHHAGPVATSGGHMEQQSQMGQFDQNTIPPSINNFSWLDLHGISDFATNNNSIAGSLMDGFDSFGDDGSADAAFSHFDPALMQGTQQMVWNGVSPPGIIF